MAIQAASTRAAGSSRRPCVVAAAAMGQAGGMDLGSQASTANQFFGRRKGADITNDAEDHHGRGNADTGPLDQILRRN